MGKEGAGENEERRMVFAQLTFPHFFEKNGWSKPKERDKKTKQTGIGKRHIQ